MKTKKCAIGIDLGTSNCAVAHCSFAPTTDDGSPLYAAVQLPQVIEIPQIVAPGQVGHKLLLPSALYFLQEHEMLSGEFELPELNSTPYLIGEGARNMGLSLADRVVTSAKSWLCSENVDRSAPILPWGSSIADTVKLSPVAVTTKYLSHIRRAITTGLAQIEGQTTDASTTKTPTIINPKETEIALTVPASFDEVARNLTVEAAKEAGFQDIILLEEPLAALYAWIAHSEGSWRSQISPGDVILVCDLGGGTADFSLVAATDNNGELELERISVGEHLLLGGDNMDLALAFQTRARLADNGSELDAWQFQTLIHLTRAAKEKLLSDSSLSSYPITIPSRGSNLFAKGISTELLRSDVTHIILEGFFPIVEENAAPQRGRNAGLREIGLAYAKDPALTKHLADFLRKSLDRIRTNKKAYSTTIQALAESRELSLTPNAVLFNGGVFNSSYLRERVLTLLNSWGTNNQLPVRELIGTDRDTAVAVGAASYAMTKLSGKGLRIKSGTTKSYYIGIESAAPAIPGFSAPVKGFCVLPFGTEEGSELDVGEETFSLLTGEESEFRLFSSSERLNDEVGTLINNADSELQESAPLIVTIPHVKNGDFPEIVHVKLHSKITEVGVLEVWLQHVDLQEHDSSARWKLEFNVRPQG
jgi:molecular chaperone DnaK (HSP70)